MADRQLFQLTTRVPSLTDVIGTQDAAGAAEQGKSTLQAIKNLMVSPAKRVVIRFSIISSAFSNQVIMESDYAGLFIVSMSRPAFNQINIKVSANILVDASKTNFQANTNGTLFIRPAIVAVDEVGLFMAQHDGTPPPAALPDFNNYFITILIYP